MPVIVHQKLMEAAEQRRTDAERKSVMFSVEFLLVIDARVRDLETLILGLKAEVCNRFLGNLPI